MWHFYENENRSCQSSVLLELYFDKYPLKYWKWRKFYWPQLRKPNVRQYADTKLRLCVMRQLSIWKKMPGLSSPIYIYKYIYIHIYNICYCHNDMNDFPEVCNCWCNLTSACSGKSFVIRIFELTEGFDKYTVRLSKLPFLCHWIHW